jgi:hypothetical protein
MPRVEGDKQSAGTSPQRHPTTTSRGTAHGRFQRAIHSRNLLNAETAREVGGLSLAGALALCELLAATDPKRYERAALRCRSGSSRSGYHP